MKWANFTAEDGSDFQIGKAQVINEGTDVSIIACGHLVWTAVEAAHELEAKGISVEVINMHTIKPLDEAAVLKSIAKTKCVVTAEEHMYHGGLGDSIAQLLARTTPKIRRQRMDHQTNYFCRTNNKYITQKWEIN